MTETPEVIYQNEATYYDLTTKKWKPGFFVLDFQQFRFICKDGSTVQFLLRDISAIEKRQCSLVFAALVVNVIVEKHWFASFPNRDTVYNLMELFWRESLFSQCHRTVSQPTREPGSSFGKELLGILHESEATLVGAANALSQQGRQIQESQDNVSDINSDLDAAERLLKSMNVATAILQTPISPRLQQPLMKQFKVVFAICQTSVQPHDKAKGILVIKPHELVLSDEHQNDKIGVNYDELSLFQVISRWELCFSKTNAETYHVTCPQLPKLLKFLDSIPSLKNKLTYERDNIFLSDKLPCTDLSSDATSSNTNMFRTENSGGSPTRETAVVSTSAKQASKSPVLETNDSTQAMESEISDEDIEQITNVLSNLQALAIEVGKEQKHQLEQIESLITDVDTTELRMKTDNKKIKKLT